MKKYEENWYDTKKYYGIKISVETSCNFVHTRKTK